MGETRKLVVVSWSGGKDSTLMLDRLLADPSVNVACLMTTVTRPFNRVSIHGVRRSILHRQAASLNLPLIEVELEQQSSNDDYETAFADGLRRAKLRFPDAEVVAFGDLFLEDVRSYRQALLARLGWTGMYPLWGESTDELAHRFIELGYRGVITCVDTTQLGAAFAGREFDAAFLDDLPRSVDPCGERGEFHTCVYAGPIFNLPIVLRAGDQILRDERFQYCDLVEVDTADQATTATVPAGVR
ncbi:MAG: ATP-binding protein [Gemmatimonadaceae bacterium]